MKIARLFILVFLMASCTSSEEEAQNSEPANTEIKELVQVQGNKYVEYYEGDGSKIKFEGTQDEQQRRHGKWLHYSENGTELSMTMYEHGLKQGHSIVHYPNGAIYYYGEYDHDTMIGIWKTYDPQGKLIQEKDYGTLRK